MTRIADDTDSMTWLCSCGRRCYAHIEWCTCGLARPAPAPDDGSRADEPVPELPPLSGARSCPGVDAPQPPWETWRWDDRQCGWVLEP